MEQTDQQRYTALVRVVRIDRVELRFCTVCGLQGESCGWVL